MEKEMNKRLVAIAIAGITLGGCATALKLTENGEKVRVLGPSEVETCRQLGKTSTSVTWVVAGIRRAEHIVAEELRVVARNSAARMGGDTVVPLTVIDQGEQQFEVYKCVNPKG